MFIFWYQCFDLFIFHFFINKRLITCIKGLIGWNCPQWFGCNAIDKTWTHWVSNLNNQYRSLVWHTFKAFNGTLCESILIICTITYLGFLDILNYWTLKLKLLALKRQLLTYFLDVVNYWTMKLQIFAFNLQKGKEQKSNIHFF